MMINSRLKEDKNRVENIIKDIRNIFRLKKLKKEINDATIKCIRNIFRLKNENKTIKGRIIRDIRNLFEHKEGNYYKPVKVNNFQTNNFIEYKSKGDRKTISLEEYVSKIRPHLKYIINKLKKTDVWNIQLTIAINFVSSKDNGQECIMHSKSGNIKYKINDEADDVTEKLLKSHIEKDQFGLEKSMVMISYLIVFSYCIINVVK